MRTLVILFFVFTCFSCEKEESEQFYFKLQTSSQSIRSYKKGGGLFIYNVVEADAPDKTIQLQLIADAGFNAALTRSELINNMMAGEICILPSDNIETKDYEIPVDEYPVMYEYSFFCIKPVI